jgi:probable HAF family extracellular repeat protein
MRVPMRVVPRLIAAVAVGAALIPLAIAGAPPQTQYRVSVLSSPPSNGNTIQDSGIVGGQYTLASGAVHAALWAFGHQLDLETLGTGAGLSSAVLWPVKNYQGIFSGISLTDALDPNKEGWSCSYFIPNPNDNVCLGFVWDPRAGKMRALPTLGGTNGFATGTNDLGETVGWAENKVHDPSCVFPQVLQFKPVLWGPAREEVHALPLIDGDTSGAATALNDRGQIVGISGACGIAVGGVSAKHAVIWDNGIATEIVNPNGAPYWNTPMMINERGDVVGFAGAPNDPNGLLTPPFLWTRKGGFVFLPLLAGDIAGTATSINQRRQIVGYSNDANGDLHPWIWQNGTTVNLNSLIEPGSGFTGTLLIAFDINDEGVISGQTSSGQAFVAVPVTPPGY